MYNTCKQLAWLILMDSCFAWCCPIIAEDTQHQVKQPFIKINQASC